MFFFEGDSAATALPTAPAAGLDAISGGRRRTSVEIAEARHSSRASYPNPKQFRATMSTWSEYFGYARGNTPGPDDVLGMSATEILHLPQCAPASGIQKLERRNKTCEGSP